MKKSTKKNKEFKNTIFIFRRDFRLNDNTALINAITQSEQVILIFIFDPNQIEKKNSYRSISAIQFMVESLRDLVKQLKKNKLHFFYGEPDQIIKKIINLKKIDAVFVNQDYTPYSKLRDKKIEKICADKNVKFESYHDYLLNKPNVIKTKKNQPYKVFTQYFNQAIKIDIKKPIKTQIFNFHNQHISGELSLVEIVKKINLDNKKNYCSGGRFKCLKILKHLDNFKNYANTHNYPAYDTTLLSAHIKFGTCSIREIGYVIKQKLGNAHPLLRQLYWHDFFTYIAAYFPEVFGKSFYKKFDSIKWNNNKAFFKAWCTGNTGFPIVDAGMRQLNKTGFMHNRCRLIVGSFLVKDLHIDWRWGEKYFAQQLTDYDPSVNNGNWQWVASTGCDRQPYFRIFNPWLQQKKFDPNCIYIKKWIPELRKIDNKIIHNWFKQKEKINNYPVPIIDHKTESAKAKKYFKEALKDQSNSRNKKDQSF